MAADDGPGPGTVLGDRYRLRRLVGEGGMGRVFLADDERDGGPVAVKLLTDDRPIPKAAQRFEREARAIARIEHANVVRVADVGQAPRGGLYYVMEFLDGEELAETLAREGPLPWPRVRHIALQICSALQAAHEAGIVHRDLKLENCFRVAREGDPDFVKILDFGVVKLLSPELDDGERLTNTGATLGTPAYMAPELCRGKQVDHRVDVYALGVMIYELLTGRVPFEGESFLDVALQHMNDPPPPLSDHVPPADLPEGLEAAVMRALAKAREDRFPTMAAFGRALERVGQPADEPRPAASQPEVLPLTAPGGTVPILPAATATEGGTVPASSAAVSTSRGTVPAVPAAASTPSGTVPALTAVATPLDPDDDVDERARPRGALRTWLVIGGVAAAGLFAGWRLTASSAPEPALAAEERVADRDAAPDPRVAPPVEPTPPPGAAAADATEAGTAAPPVPVAAPEAPAPSPRLTARQVDDVLRRIDPRIKACAGPLTGGRHGERVRVVLVVDLATGRVESVAPSDPRHRSAVESCLVGVLRKATFPRVGGRGVQKLSRTLVL